MNFALLQAAADNNQQTGSSWITLVIYLVVIGGIFYFMLIRPQKKKQKEEEKLKNSLQIGDEIITIGGFYGKIVSIKEDSLVIESQLDHTKQKIARWGVQQNLTVHEAEAEKPIKVKKNKKDSAEENLNK